MGCCLVAQEATWLGIQVTPLAIGTLDLHLERQLTPTISIHVGTGLRSQQIDRREPRVKLLSDFSNLGNTAAYTSLGLRLANPETGTDYPYVRFGLTGVWFRDHFQTILGEQKRTQGIAWGPSATIGYLIHFDNRWELDSWIADGLFCPQTRFAGVLLSRSWVFDIRTGKIWGKRRTCTTCGHSQVQDHSK